MKKLLLILLCFLLSGCANDSIKITANKNPGILHYVDFRSSVDKDHDGVDDATDIVKAVREYVATDPIYKSAYYAGGYPNDGHGVCTDVVAFALLHAGYDLQEEVYLHIMNNRDLYDIDIVDKNIDFRRVRNLIIFFNHNFHILTNDISKIEEWQGGDIVVFHEHIGIVSDNRNHKGIPFVIHHRGKYQLYYEEDILENSKVIGHYRAK